MADVIIKYRAEFGGLREDKETATKVLKDTWDGTEACELVEPDVWSLTKENGFSEDELRTIADQIIEAAPELYFSLDIMHYDSETKAKHIKFRLRYFRHKIEVYRDMI